MIRDADTKGVKIEEEKPIALIHDVRIPCLQTSSHEILFMLGTGDRPYDSSFDPVSKGGALIARILEECSIHSIAKCRSCLFVDN